VNGNLSNSVTGNGVVWWVPSMVFGSHNLPQQEKITMKQCNYCDNKQCGLIHSDWPDMRDFPPKRLIGVCHLSCRAHVPVVPVGKGFGYLRDTVENNNG